MNKTRLWDGGHQMEFEYVEMDPSERYGRSNDVLGKGAMKTVYRAFDEFLATEVAWNQVKLNDVFTSPEELQRLYSEVHLLKSLNHESIMRFRASWIDVDRRTFNFITELFTSGTLREYRKKYPRVNIRAIKDWSRQILEGLYHLHSHDPPIIHRDLKCDNIFVNGHVGQVKIGDLGLAAILRGSHHAHSVIGTPEFMAPELYEEDYDELVDVYSFGMCVLEMLTSEYPYGECSNPAQIYKKVTSGKLPEAFYRIHDPEARRFVGRCLEKAPGRPSAHELLMDPFLSIEKVKESPRNKPSPRAAPVSLKSRADMAITGSMNPEDEAIFLKVQILNKNGNAKNVYFPFDIVSDTALDVATEMVKELDINDWEPREIADMIDDEVSALVPSWKIPEEDDDDDGHPHPPLQLQHSFEYEDDEDYNDDNTPGNPFYCDSSDSSSQASLAGLFSPRAASAARISHERSLYSWLEEESRKIRRDDACCTFSSGHEDHRLVSDSCKEPHNYWTKKSSTRFCPEKGKIGKCGNYNNVDVGGYCCSKIPRTGSLVDIRSQLLHQRLAEEMSKRRMFKTVGAVEHIGYLDPREIACRGSSYVIDTSRRIIRFK